MRDFEIAQTGQSLATFTHMPLIICILNSRLQLIFSFIGVVLENGTGLSGHYIEHCLEKMKSVLLFVVLLM